MNADVNSIAHRRRHRVVTRLCATALGLIMAATSVTAQADPATDPTFLKRVHAQVSSSTSQTSGSSSTDVSPAASETGNALALVNRFRAQSGLRAATYDSNLDAALRAHANYVQLNQNATNFDPYTENPTLPGYTDAGAALAPYTSLTYGSASYDEALRLLMMDPYERSGRFLDPNLQGVSITRTTDFTVFAFSWSTVTTSPALVFPKGSGYSDLAFGSSIAPFYTGSCPQQSAAWGYPITVQFDYRQFDSLTSVSSSLTRDGVPVGYCLLWTFDQTGIPAMAIMIPTAPLVQGAHYAGHVTATGIRSDGSTGASTRMPIGFTTNAPVTTTPGDQTGDNVADVVAVDSTGALRLYKGVRPSRIGYGWAIGSGWSSFTWLAHTKDINGDGREDLLARRSDGNLYLYLGTGMGSYGSAKQVGKGWNGLRQLTVVGDMSGTGALNVVGITADGAMMRYNLTANGMSGVAKIGQGWSGMTRLASVGDFNGDKIADIIAVRSDGLLYAYYNRAGAPFTSKLVGRGWSGFTALFSPGDLTGDKRPDLIGRNAAGELYSFENRMGAWGAGVKAGQGWGGFTLFG